MSVDTFQLFLLSLPLLFMDWQIALIWAFAVSNATLLSQIQALDFQGLELWIIFLAMGALRRWVFK